MNTETDLRLKGAWLAAARAVWLAFFVLSVLALAAAVPVHWADLTHPAASALANLGALGLTTNAYAVISIGSDLAFAAIYALVGLILFARRSDDRMALLTSLMLVSFGMWNGTITPTMVALYEYPWGAFAYACGGYMAWATFTQFPFLFPSGRYVPRWSIIAALTWLILCIPWNFMVGTPFYPPDWPVAVFAPLLIALWGSFVVSQVHRYRRVSTPVERQQTKWVMYALAVMIASLAGLVLVALLYEPGVFAYFAVMPIDQVSTPPMLALWLASNLAAHLVFLLLPVALAFSILRYRLWDIDVIIRRTLQYSLLTGLLALIYFGGVALLQGLLSRLTGQAQSPLVVVGSTLLIAALFNPLRLRIRAFIDRRFYRARYDAERTLARFAATARDEVDIERLTDALLGAVGDTLQPSEIRVWVAGPETRE